MSPTLADGWFSDPPHMVLQVKNCDVTELRGLLGTLVPAAEYKVLGKTIVVTGKPEDLAQVKELFQEIDKPLSRVIIDIYGFEMLEGDLQYYGFDISDSSVRGRVVIPGCTAFYNPGSPFRFQESVGQIRPLFKEFLETDLGSVAYFKIPHNVATAIFASDSGSLSVEAKLLPKDDLLAHLLLKTRSPIWEDSVRLNFGESFVICGKSKRVFLVVRLHPVN